MDAFGLVCSSTNTELSFSLWLCFMAKSTQHCLLSETGWKRTNCANRPEKEKKRPIELQSCGNDEDKCQQSRKCWVCRYIGQTHPYIHILKTGLMSTATIKSVLSEKALALWPICWRSESNDAVLLWAIKQGGGNCRGQSYSEVESPRVLKRRPLSVCSHLNFGVFSLPLSFSCRYFRSGSPASPKVWSHRWLVTSVTSHWLQGWISRLSLLVLAGCNSNSMWKLCMFHWKCCYLQRATECSAKPQLLR